MTIIYAGATDIGRKRSSNQDSICIFPQRNFFAVADGMGGHNGGDIASQMSVKLLPEYIESNFASITDKLLKDSISHVNNEIYQHGIENKELKGMGTTVTGVLFNGEKVFIANVGDSRTYMIHKNKLFQMTRDHSMVQEKINLEIYTREQAKHDPHKNVISRTVGFEQDVNVDVYQYKISKNDLFLMCSDGLHGKVSDEDILYIINREISDIQTATTQDLERTVKVLIDQANQNGGDDNISVIMALTR